MTKIVHGIHVDEIGNLQDLLRLVFIYEESGYIKKSLMVERLIEISTKRRSQML